MWHLLKMIVSVWWICDDRVPVIAAKIWNPTVSHRLGMDGERIVLCPFFIGWWNGKTETQHWLQWCRQRQKISAIFSKYSQWGPHNTNNRHGLRIKYLFIAFSFVNLHDCCFDPSYTVYEQCIFFCRNNSCTFRMNENQSELKLEPHITLIVFQP